MLYGVPSELRAELLIQMGESLVALAIPEFQANERLWMLSFGIWLMYGPRQLPVGIGTRGQPRPVPRSR